MSPEKIAASTCVRASAETARHAFELVGGVWQRTELAYCGNIGLTLTEVIGDACRALAAPGPALPGCDQAVVFARAGFGNADLSAAGLAAQYRVTVAEERIGCR